MNVVEEAEQILKSKINWMQLDLDIDLVAWKREAAIAYQYMVDHRSSESHKGWRSCTLHGEAVNVTTVTNNKNFSWTELGLQTNCIRKFWQTFPSEKYNRIRFMDLQSSGWVSTHNDSPNGLDNTQISLMDDPFVVPINIAINHPDDCNMIVGNKQVPWSEGKAFIINITKDHSVKNNSKENRLHLIAHCAIGNMKEKFSELVVRSYYKYND